MSKDMVEIDMLILLINLMSKFYFDSCQTSYIYLQ